MPSGSPSPRTAASIYTFLRDRNPDIQALYQAIMINQARKFGHGKSIFIQCGCWEELWISLYGCQTPGQHWIKILHPWVQEFYPLLGLGSGGRLLRHFQTPTLHWIYFSLRGQHSPFHKAQGEEKNRIGGIYHSLRNHYVLNSNTKDQPGHACLQSLAVGAELKVTEPNLRFPALFCNNLRFSAVLASA